MVNKDGPCIFLQRIFFCFVGVPPFIQPSLYRRTFGLFPGFSY